jgi:hypothetical protein
MNRISMIQDKSIELSLVYFGSTRMPPSLGVRGKVCGLTCSLLFAAIGLFPSQSRAAGPVAPQVRHPAHSVRASVKLRTPAEMDEAELTAMSPTSSGSAPFRSTISTDELTAFKAEVGLRAPVARRISRSRSGMAAPVRAAPINPPIIQDINVNGVGQGTGILIPPDTHGAAGASQFVEVVNQKFVVYSKDNPPKLLKNVSLASFFGYTAPFPGLFDPRVIYDPTWKRWVVTANAFHESPGVQPLLIAISKTPSATGAFYVVRDFNTDIPNNGQFTDFPQLGMDQDAIILTTNVFQDETETSPYLRSEVITFAKARAYNGFELEAQFFDAGLSGTIAPPIVLDQNANTFLVAAAAVDYPNGTSLSLFKLTNSSRSSGALLADPVPVPVANYGVPNDAQQPDTTDTLLAGDARFANASTQVGDTLWQVHTVNTGDGLPTPVWYKINTEAQTVAEQGQFYSTATSFDFNASIVANQEGDMFVTWSSTDPTPDLGFPAVNAQVRFSGRTVGDPETDLSPGTALFTSSTFYSPGPDFGSPPWPWGDYSAITIDPANDMQAWLVNQKTNSTGRWGSRIGRIAFPSP